MHAIVLMLSLLSGGRSEFCEGYRAGYKAAYCAGHTVDCWNRVPMRACPRSEPDETMSDGYNRGWEDGEGAHNRGHN